jgi:isocitrate dehydrogenase
LKPVTYKAEAGDASASRKASAPWTAAKKDLVGVDVYLDWTKGSSDDLGASVEKLAGEGLKVSTISNRGVKVWPGGNPETFLSDHWRCRFVADSEGGAVSHKQVAALLNRFAGAGFDYIKTENLYNFDDKPGYSHVQE